MRTGIGLGACVLALAACSSARSSREKHAASDEDVAVLASWLSGSFSSEAQHKADTRYFDVRLHHARIWAASKDGEWLYVEQARGETQDAPYRQAVYHLHAIGEEIVSDPYSLPDAARVVGAWRNVGLLKDLTPAALTPREGCSIHFRRKGDGMFEGSTLGTGCPSDRQGAVFATSEVTVTATMVTSWDRGFDEKGAQVWGAVDGPYQFAKQL